jgi:sec-independent protein translocase protein TatA
MIGDLFDSPWKIAIIAILVIVMFGSKKLPDAARSLGKSMRILKTEVQGLHEDDTASTTTTFQTAQTVQPVQPAQPIPGQLQVGTTANPAAATDAQAQIDALSKQLADLQQTVSANKASDGAQAQ